MAIAPTSGAKIAQLRIERALAKPGATGMKGFLLWTEAAFPRSISHKILQAAAKYTPGAGPPVTLASPASGGFAGFGDYTVVDPNNPDNYVTLAAGQTISSDSSGNTVIRNADGSTTPVTSANATNPPVSAVTAATPAAPASASWVSDISSAVTAATTALLGVKQISAAQQIFDTNLSRAQQGLPPIPTNPTQYGLPAPTAQIGLTSSTQNTVLLVGGGIAAALVLAAVAGGRKRA